MIVPLAVVCTQRMGVVQEIIEGRGAAWYANFAWRPGKLFDGVNRALTIFCLGPAERRGIYSTGYTKWVSETRSSLFPRLAFTEYSEERSSFWVPKLSHPLERAILAKLIASGSTVGTFVQRTGRLVFYRTTGGLYWKVFTNFAPKFIVDGASGHSSRETSFAVETTEHTRIAVALLSSNTFWWWYTLTSNLRDLNPSDITLFPIARAIFSDKQIADLGRAYVTDLKRNSVMLAREQKQTGHTETQSFKIAKSKGLIDEIDRALARHYRFTHAELDFIINYDIKYRTGDALEGEE